MNEDQINLKEKQRELIKIEENKIVQMRLEYNHTNNLVKDEKKKIQKECDKQQLNTRELIKY